MPTPSRGHGTHVPIDRWETKLANGERAIKIDGRW
jgi:hypothetical protein